MPYQHSLEPGYGGTAVWFFKFHFVCLELMGVLLQAICTGPSVVCAVSMSCKGSYWFHDDYECESVSWQNVAATDGISILFLEIDCFF